MLVGHRVLPELPVKPEQLGPLVPLAPKVQLEPPARLALLDLKVFRALLGQQGRQEQQAKLA